MALVRGDRLGPYQIEAPIGWGGMGEVYRARDARLGRTVAVKILTASMGATPDQLRRLQQEARAAGSLNHPNTLVIYDTGDHQGAPYVVSELLEGETLRERISRGPLSPRQVSDFAVQIAEGLSAAHEKGIVHRDLKPENIFLTRDDRVKILDFGLAKIAAPLPTPLSPDAATAALLTPAPGSSPGMIVGTVGYMSPEQVRGEETDHRSDIFSFGVILYEMVTGRRPFLAASPVETMNAILNQDPEDPASFGVAIPPSFDRVIRHCLEKNPRERFQSARDLVFNLQAVSGISSTTGPVWFAARSGPSRRKFRRASRWLALGAALGAAAFAVGRLSTRRSAPSYQQLTFGRGAVLSGRFAPDGQTVVFSAAWDGGPMQLFSARPGSPEARPLGLADASLHGISVGGEMALSLHHCSRGGIAFAGTLARAPLAGGVPREVLESIADAAWSADGSALAVVRTGSGFDRLEFPPGKVLHKTTGWIAQPRFSPRGDAIAFIDHPHWPDDGGDVALVDLAGNERVLAESWSSLQGLAWSPNGQEVWFTAARTGKTRALHAATLTGDCRLVARIPGCLTLQDVYRDGRALLTRDSIRFQIAGRGKREGRERDLSWLDGSVVEDLSADGRTLLFWEGGEGGESGGLGPGVYLRGTDASPAVRLGDGLPTQLSPDGKWVLAIERTTSTHIVLLPQGAGESRAIPAGGLIEHTFAFWFPDARRLVVTATEPGHGLRSYAQEIGTGAVRPLTPEGALVQLVSPDGSSVVAGGDNLLAFYPVVGGGPRPVPGSRPGDRAVQWSPDRRALFVHRRDEVPGHLYRLDLATGERLVVRDLAPADPAGVVAVIEARTTPDGQAYAYSYLRVLSELYLADGLR